MVDGWFGINIRIRNVDKEGGGAVASKNYKTVLNQFNCCEFQRIIDSIQGLDYIFMCGDIFTKLQSILPRAKQKDCSKFGIEYPSGKKRAMKYENIIIYEIVHPSRSPKLTK